ncbi:enoyl-CoA hydratase/isomerase family protein [Nocardia callitridis]|uniref:Enoyl-CoA hydratase n=1 Tax=Nocardia callitridis TaxID=648753 RepID=A0ABP9KFN3_9NOCA
MTTTPTSAHVTTVVRDRVAWLEFDGSRAFDGAFWTDLGAALSTATALDVRCLALTGGSTFSIGNNLAWLSRSVGTAMRRGDRRTALHASGEPMRQVARLLGDSPVVTIAAVAGDVVGAGAELACLTDLRICLGPVTVTLPEPQLGVVPDLAPPELLDDVLGSRTARRLLLAGQSLHMEPPTTETFADYGCRDITEADALLHSLSASFATGAVLPRLRRAAQHARLAEDAAAFNSRICEPTEFRASIRRYVEDKHG